MNEVIAYTDGSCLGNPGPGGYGVVLTSGDRRKEFSGGYKYTTNNRMELLACIEAFKALSRPYSVILYSDSKYVVDGIMKGWALTWQANKWRKKDGGRAENIDLWDQLLSLIAEHQVEFRWIKAHNGNPANIRCDELAKNAANGTNLPEDTGYSVGRGGPQFLDQPLCHNS